MRVAAVQLPRRRTRTRNLAVAGEARRRGGRRRRELVALPELFNRWGSARELREGAEPLDGPSRSPGRASSPADRARLAARGEHHRADRRRRRTHNTSCLIAPDGEIVATYRKIHLFDVDVRGLRVPESATVTPGDEIVVADAGPLRIGMSICYDLRFPEEFRIQALAARPSSRCRRRSPPPTGKDHWEPLLRARAIENQVFVIAPDQRGREHAEAALARSVDDRRPVGGRARAGARHASASSPPTWTSTRRRDVRTTHPEPRPTAGPDLRLAGGPMTRARRSRARFPPGTRRRRARAARRGARVRAGLALRLARSLYGDVWVHLARVAEAHRAASGSGRRCSSRACATRSRRRARSRRVGRARARAGSWSRSAPASPAGWRWARSRSPWAETRTYIAQVKGLLAGRVDGGRRRGREDDAARRAASDVRSRCRSSWPRTVRRGSRSRSELGDGVMTIFGGQPGVRRGRALLAFGTVLDPGEDPGLRAGAARGRSRADGRVPRHVRGRSGPGRRAARRCRSGGRSSSGSRSHLRHLAHPRGSPGARDRARPPAALRATGLTRFTWTGEAATLRDRLDATAAAGTTEILYAADAAPTSPVSSDAFMAMATA